MIKQRIIEKASDLFGRSGVKRITMDDLAKHLGISKRTIYENFKDKEALLIACVNAFHAESRTFAQKVLLEADNVADAIVALLRKDAEQASQLRFKIIEDVRKYYPRVYKEQLVSIYADKSRDFEQMIKRGMEEGVFRESLNPEIIVHFFCTQAENAVHNDLFLHRFSLSEVFENLAVTFLRGICTARGLEIIDQYKEKVNNHIDEDSN